MSTPQDRQDEPPAALPARSRRGVVVGAMAIGIGLGAWQGAPHLAPRLGLCAEGAAPVRAAFSFPLGSSGHDGDASEPARARLVELDDLVLNPAGTDGARFLVLALAMDMRDEEGVRAAREHDPAVRDVILTLLSAKTVAELSDITARPALREELRDGLNGVLGEGSVLRIYLPRFVIQ